MTSKQGLYDIEMNGEDATVKTRRGVSISEIEEREMLTEDAGWQRMEPYPYKILGEIIIFRYKKKVI